MSENLNEIIQKRHQINTNETHQNDPFAKAYEFQKVIVPLRNQNSYPYFQALQANLGTEVLLQSKKVIMLGSNNYLGLTTDPRVREAAIQAIKDYGTSMTGSRLLNGTLELHEIFEEEIADFLGKEAALIFTTGYQANLGVLSALANSETKVFMDKQNHASLYDAAKLSDARIVYFKHNHPADFEKQVLKAKDEAKLLVVDGIYSMEGDISPIPDLLKICKAHGVRMIVDDAHAIGVLGEKGQGATHHFGVSGEVDLLVATFSKSLASTGGYVAGDKEIIDYIKHYGRPMIFSASITPPNLASAREALHILKQEPERVTRLRDNSRYIKNGLKQMGWEVGGDDTPIIPVHIGNDLITLNLWKELLHAGVYINPVVYPAVDPDKALLRLSVMATHEKKHLDLALEAFEKVGKRQGLINPSGRDGLLSS